MLRPMISMAMKPHSSEAMPRAPRYTGPICASPKVPSSQLVVVMFSRDQLPGFIGTPMSAGP